MVSFIMTLNASPPITMGLSCFLGCNHSACRDLHKLSWPSNSNKIGLSHVLAAMQLMFSLEFREDLTW